MWNNTEIFVGPMGTIPVVKTVFIKEKKSYFKNSKSVLNGLAQIESV